MTKIGYFSKKRSPRRFYFSVWFDFMVLLILYFGLVGYTISLFANL